LSPAPGGLQAVANRLYRKACGVLHPIEAFFFYGGNQLPITNHGRRSVPVIGVNPKNIHFW